ncbi:uncharacterized protein METZ01_LOCUS399696, partial [marine metagenome]
PAPCSGDRNTAHHGSNATRPPRPPLMVSS